MPRATPAKFKYPAFHILSMEKVQGFSYDGKMPSSAMADALSGVGFQATQIGRGAKIIREMRKGKAVVFLTFTSNMASSGLRELIAQIVREKKVDAIITGIGSIEEDVMKCGGDFDLATFDENDIELNKKGVNRIGNILVGNSHYIKFEKTMLAFFESEYRKQLSISRLLSPSEIIFDLGKALHDENSFVYQAAKNSIPIFCPCPTDGAFGLQLYFFKQKRKDFGIDVTGDMARLAQIALDAEKTGGIILGGGFAKHHALGVNLLRGGFDYAVYVSTGTEYDGSLSGARAKEAKSWGKINAKAHAVHIDCDATIALPLLAGAILE